MDALGILVDRHQARVLRYTRSLTRDAGAAEDALQQCFLDALRGAGSFAGRSSVQVWLLALARNAVFRGQRKRAGEPSGFVPLHELGGRAGWGRPTQHIALERHAVQSALAGLPAEFREVLVLRELEGFTGPETAALLGITLSAQKSRLHRARLQLAAQLNQEVCDGP